MPVCQYKWFRPGADYNTYTASHTTQSGKLSLSHALLPARPLIVRIYFIWYENIKQLSIKFISVHISFVSLARARTILPNRRLRYI